MPTLNPVPPAGVVLVTAEDGIADTIRPRLEAAGADLERVIVVQTVPGEKGPRHPIIPDDLDLIERAVRRVGAKLVVIDPLFAYLGGKVNSYRDQDIRSVLAQLADFSGRLQAAVVVIRHLNKTAGGNPLYRGGGSIGIIGAARVAMLVGRDPNDDNLLVLAPTKNNLARFPSSLAFQLDSAPDDPDTARIEWVGSSDLSAAELLRGRASGKDENAIKGAAQWLAEVLRDGPRPAAWVYEEAESAGIAERTLKRAKKKLGVKTDRVEGIGSKGYWIWTLETASEVAKEAIPTDGPLSAEKTPTTGDNPPNRSGKGPFTKGATVKKEESGAVDGPVSRSGSLRKGQRVRTPAGEGEIWQVLLGVGEVRVLVGGKVLIFSPEEIELLEDAPF